MTVTHLYLEHERGEVCNEVEALCPMDETPVLFRVVRVHNEEGLLPT